MNFSYDRSWARVMDMARPNVSILLTIGGVFMFLPSLALWLISPVPEPASDTAATLQGLIAWYQRSFPGLLANAVSDLFGQASILVLLLDGRRPTVGDALSRALRLLPALFVVTLLVNLSLIAGFAMLILPAIYLVGRFYPVVPAMVAEGLVSPRTALTKAWQMTRGLGWRIAGFVLMVWVLSTVALSAATSVLKVVAGFVLPEAARSIAGALADAGANAAISVLLAVLSAAVYRELRSDAVRTADIFT